MSSSSSSICYDPSSGAPIPCGGFTVYNSYVTDPEYQHYFTIAWTGTLALAILLTVPSVLASLSVGRWRRRSWAGLLLGISERPSSAAYERVDDGAAEKISTQPIYSNPSRPFVPVPVSVISSLYRTVSRSSLGAPLSKFSPRLAFPFGKLVLVLLIPLFYLVTLFPESQLRENPNRFGFLALAGLPPLFLLSSKNGAASWLLGKSWTTVNFLHRWLARMIVLMVLLHFYFWTIQYAPTGTVTDFLSGSKERRGIGALSFLILIAISSAGPLRRYSYPLFFCLHYLGVIGFLTFVNMHTIYARTWATWSIGLIYAVDVFARICTMRVKYVTVEPLGEGMTKVHIPFAHDGWRGGQHLQLRLFFTAPGRSIWSYFRSFEQHPFSITNASSSTTVLQTFSTMDGIDLHLRSCGPHTWTEDVYQSVVQAKRISEANARHLGKKLYMLALIEGPYGGIDAYDPVKEETLLFLAGGSGMSFILGTLDQIVGTRIRERQGGKIEVVWVVHRLEHVEWFRAPLKALIESASTSVLDLVVDLQVYVTTLSSADALDPETSSFAKIIHARPSLKTIIRTSIDSTLIPCRRCYPICRCADLRQDGLCANDDEECVGSATVANARDLIMEEEMTVEREGSEEKGKRKSCCSPSTDAEDPEDEKKTNQGGGTCCSKSKGTERYCGDGVGTVKVETRGVVEGAVRVRKGSYKVIVCGPASMIVETRQILARIPLAKQIKLGGIGLHVEAYGV
ncbi:BQ2448_3114 [Microbotryum intermedium]|uniref:BQ2448_3114 protein n=1 Tax=Microbotryum intermedium TaxID=269621 RepID=A0A238FKD2_9BASI|nr:BQ2448_3114 [Microbotryum intermedium]